MQPGAIILCGGESTRMGRDKAGLPFGSGETMLQRVLRLVSQAVPLEHVVCVASPGQLLPRLPGEIHIVFDATPHHGPLAGLAAGLAALQDDVDAAFVTGCDVPLLVPAVISRMFQLIGSHELAAPHDGTRWHPLVGVYRTDVLPRVESLLGGGSRSLVALLEACNTRQVATEELRDVDPQLASLITCNTPDDYQEALRLADASLSV